MLLPTKRTFVFKAKFWYAVFFDFSLGNMKQFIGSIKMSSSGYSLFFLEGFLPNKKHIQKQNERESLTRFLQVGSWEFSASNRPNTYHNLLDNDVKFLRLNKF
jgi:hypothetical protein